MSLVVAQPGVGTDWSRQGGGRVCICVCKSVRDNDLKEHSSKRATSFFYVSVSSSLEWQPLGWKENRTL